MTPTVLGVLQVLLGLQMTGHRPSLVAVTRLTGKSDLIVSGAVTKLSRWKLVDPVSLRPTLAGERAATRLRASMAP
jgi:hypothetical protein